MQTRVLTYTIHTGTRILRIRDMCIHAHTHVHIHAPNTHICGAGAMNTGRRWRLAQLALIWLQRPRPSEEERLVWGQEAEVSEAGPGLLRRGVEGALRLGPQPGPERPFD